jgi:hypothetical protein
VTVPPDAVVTGLSDLAVRARVDAGQVNTVPVLGIPVPGCRAAPAWPARRDVPVTKVT